MQLKHCPHTSSPLRGRYRVTLLRASLWIVELSGSSVLKARLREQPLPLSLPDSYLGRHRIIDPESFAAARLTVPFEPLGTNFNMPESEPGVKK